MANSEFAKRQMKKHGWKEGSGLGKDEHGMADPIKVSLKMDKTGVGHDPGKEFTDHWWLRVFNEAAQKIGKKDKGQATQPETEEAKAKSKKEEQRKNFYKGFVQSSTLTNGVETKTVSSDSSSEDEKDNSSVSVPTLDDIHKFCGGATGHKAARFGIRMEGKVARASHHEKLFEEQIKVNGSKDIGGEESLKSLGTEKTKKKKKKDKNDNSASEKTEVQIEDIESEDRKKRKKRDLQLEDDNLLQKETPSKKRKKKRKNSEYDINVAEVVETPEENTRDSKTEESVMANSNQEFNLENKRKKKKKKKSHDNIDGNNDGEERDKSCGKKKKKRKEKL